MDIKFCKKKAIITAMVAILVAIVVSTAFLTYKILSEKALPSQGGIPKDETVTIDTTIDTNFTETGNILNWDSKIETHTDDWTLLYEKPGSPAISVKLIFDETSFCNYSIGWKVCDKSMFNNGDRVEIVGERNNGEVTVRNLTK